MAINFHIRTTNIDLTPDVSNQVHNKLSIIDKFLSAEGDKKILAKIEIGLLSNHHQKGDVYHAEANVNCDGKDYFAETRASSLEAALDELKDEIGKVVKRKVSKMSGIHRAGGRLLKKLMRR